MKDNKAKRKVVEKVAKAKAKIKGKLKKACVVAALLAAFACVVGCATSEPASRATTARYGDIFVRVDEGARDNKITLTIGDGALASADSAGSTETMTANPTNDVKPDIDVSVPVNKAGAAQSVGSALGDAAASLIRGTTGAKSAATVNGEAPANGGCEGGACRVPAE